MNPVEYPRLQVRRAELHRRLRWTTLALVALVLIAAGLAASVGWYAVRAHRFAVEADQAHQEADASLAQALLHSARLEITSDEVGARVKALEAIRQAVEIQGPSEDLRREAVACLAKPCLVEEQSPVAMRPGRSWTLAVSPDLTRLLCCEHGSPPPRGALRIRALPTGSVSGTWIQQSAHVTELAWSPDGQYAVVWRAAINLPAENNVLEIRSTRDGSVLASGHYDPKYPDLLRAGKRLDFSADGQRIAVLERVRATVSWLECPSGKEIGHKTFPGKVKSFALHPGGDQVAVLLTNALGQVLEVWRADGSGPLARIPWQEIVRDMTWSPDGEMVVLVGKEIWFWRPNADAVVDSELSSGLCERVFFDPTGRWLATVSVDRRTQIWDWQSGEQIGCTRAGRAIQFSQEGGRLLYETADGKVGIWRIEDHKRLRQEAAFRTIASRGFSVDLSPNGEHVLLGTHLGIAVWQPRDGLHVAARTEAVRRNFKGVWFARDGNAVVEVSSNAVWLRELRPESSTKRLTLSEPVRIGPSSAVQAAGINRGETNYLAICDGTNAFRLNLTTLEFGAPIPMPSSYRIGEPGGLQVTPHPTADRVLFSRGRHPTMLVGPGISRALTLAPVGGRPELSSDGRWLLVSQPERHALYDLKADGIGRSFRCARLRDHNAAAALSPLGTMFALCPSIETIELYRVDTGQSLGVTEGWGHGAVFDLAFSADEKRLAVARGEGRAEIWDLQVLENQLSRLGLGRNHHLADRVVEAPAQRTFHSDSLLAISWPITGMALALVSAIFLFLHQRKLAENYLEVEVLVAERNARLVRTEVELVQSQKMEALGTLAAGVAHDFNNLLSVIKLSTGLMARRRTDGAAVEKELGAVREAVEEGQHLIDSMLGYSRARDSTPTRFKPGQLLSDTVAMLSQRFLAGLTLELDADPATPEVTAPRARLQQMLLNLIINASDAMQRRGRLTLRARPLVNVRAIEWVVIPPAAPGYVEIAVEDTGPGITPENLQRVFEPFFTTKTRGAAVGTGLGLATVHTIARLEHFGLAVASEPGRGTLFRIAIPMTLASSKDEGAGDIRIANNTATAAVSSHEPVT